MTTLQELEAIQAAYAILSKSQDQLCRGVSSIYAIPRNAQRHLSKRAAELLAEGVE